jgi:glycosyltransferase involved in cell wall biosynthesis
VADNNNTFILGALHANITNIVKAGHYKLYIYKLVENKTIAYISEASPHNKHAWSGTVHYVYKALLGSNFRVIALGPASPVLVRYLLGFLNKASLLFFRKRFDYRHSVLYAKSFAGIFNRRLKKISYDMIVICGNTECGAYLVSNKPVYYVLDRTIAGAIGYHTILSGLWKFSRLQSIRVDRRAMENASGIFFSSEWAADHAKQLYAIPQSRITIMPFGANIDKTPSRAQALQVKETKKWKLLLVGTYWLNKGADIAVNALMILLKMGYDVSLTVVGCTPPEPITHPNLHIIPFIDKNSGTGMAQLWELFISHHFFILPTRFDCTPIVFCEASAFGLPVLCANTGGVAGHVKEGVNGFLLPYHDKGEGYAARIAMLINDPVAYDQLRHSTRALYETELNWTTWAERFEKKVSSV